MCNLKKHLLYFFLLLLTGALVACDGKKIEPAPATDNSLMDISPEQFRSSGMQTGPAIMHRFHDQVECKGYVSAPANATSEVCPPIAGKIVSIHYKPGNYVPAGSVIATISGNDFMALQQNFAEAAAAYSKAKADFERANALWAEKIGAQKDFEAAKTTLRAAQASYLSLRSRIQAVGVSAKRIEGGHMYTSYPVMAPIGGHIIQTHAVIGQYVDVDSNIANIINLNALQLKLSVNETDVRKLKPGQTIHYGTTGSNNRNLQAHLTSIGKTVNPETRMIECLATISHADGAPLINEGYVEANIIVHTWEAQAVPVTAVQKEDNQYYVFVVENRQGGHYKLKKTPINIGASDESYMEVRTSLPNKDIILQGIDTMQ